LIIEQGLNPYSYFPNSGLNNTLYSHTNKQFIRLNIHFIGLADWGYWLFIPKKLYKVQEHRTTRSTMTSYSFAESIFLGLCYSVFQ